MRHKTRLLKLLKQLRGKQKHAGAGAAAYVSSSEERITRRILVERALHSARADSQFMQLAQAGDAARDRGDWAEAASQYRLALHRCPLHANYRVQYAHMLKECGQFADAELNYRVALANGAPVGDVQQHLNFVCERTGGPAYDGQPLNLDAPLQLAPAGIDDVHSLAYILWPNRGVSQDDCLQLLRPLPNVRDLAADMIDHRYFVERNGRFLAMLKA